jgi:hypothetical protein
MESVVHGWDTASTVRRVAENNGKNFSTTVLRHASANHSNKWSAYHLTSTYAVMRAGGSSGAACMWHTHV